LYKTKVIDVCLEIPEIKINVRDDDLRQMLRHQFGIDAIKIYKEMREKQDDILRAMKEVEGTNIR
jgi:putative transposase